MSKTKAAAPKQPKLTSAEGAPISEATPLGAGMFELANRFVVAVEQLAEETASAKLMLMHLSEHTVEHQAEVLKLAELTYNLTAKVSGQLEPVNDDQPYKFKEVTTDRSAGNQAPPLVRAVLPDVVVERDALAERLDRLRHFIGSSSIFKVSLFEQSRLKRQIAPMQDYLNILNDRIAGLQRELMNETAIGV